MVLKQTLQCVYFTWQHLVHSTAWVPTGGSLTPWMPYTDLVLPGQHPGSTDETYSLLNFWEECLDKDNDVCMTGHKKKSFCGVIYCSNRPWQQLDSMVITTNQALKEENWTFLLPALAARSRWSQFHHGLQYFYPGCNGTAAFWRATEQPGSQKPGGDLFPMDSVWSTLGDALAQECTRRTQAHRNMVLLMLGVALALSGCS